MTEQWQELKETILEMRDNDGTCTQQEVCEFLANYMDVLEKQMWPQDPCDYAEYHGTEDMDGLYYCPICQQTTTVVKDGNKCPKCGSTMDELSTRAQQTKDTISRQAVLDAMQKNHRYGGRDIDCDGGYIEGGYRERLYDDVISLPPVTSQQKDEDIAKAFQFGLALGFGKKHDEMDKVIDEIKKVITPTGHWIYYRSEYGDYLNKCSVCEQDCGVGYPYNYCPNCGAKMEN